MPELLDQVMDCFWEDIERTVTSFGGGRKQVGPSRVECQTIGW
jgi:hypothetical protein